MSEVKLTQPNGSLYKNQKAVRTIKARESKERTDVRVSDIFKNDLMATCRALNESELKLYLYLLSNQDGYVGGLSMEDVKNKTGISQSSYRRAVDGLIEKGYLVYTHEQVSDYLGVKAPLYDFIAWSKE